MVLTIGTGTETIITSQPRAPLWALPLIYLYVSVTSIFYTVKFSNEKSVVLGNTYPKMVKRYEKMVASYMYGKKLKSEFISRIWTGDCTILQRFPHSFDNCLLQF